MWALLVDGRFGHGLPPAEPFPLPIHTGDVRVDVQAGLAMLAPIWGYKPLLDTDEATARDQLARASVMALSYVAQSARGIYQPAVPQRVIDECPTVTARFMTRWQGEPDPRHVEAIDAYWVSAAEHGMNASTFTARVIASTGADVAASLSGAIGAMSGPLHGGAPARVLPMLEEVERTGDARGLVKRILDRGDKLMGFGHRVYRAEDPRARVLRGAAERLGAPRHEVAVALEQAALAELRERRPDRAIETNVEFWAAVILDFARGAGQHDAGDVHLRAHRGMVRPHPRAEAARQAGPPVGHLRGAGPAQPGSRRGLGPGSHQRLSCADNGCRCPAIEWICRDDFVSRARSITVSPSPPGAGRNRQARRPPWRSTSNPHCPRTSSSTTPPRRSTSTSRLLAPRSWAACPVPTAGWSTPRCASTASW